MFNKVKQLIDKWLYKDTTHEYKFVFYTPKYYSHRLFKYFVDLYHEGGGLYFKEPVHETENIDSFEMTVVCSINHISSWLSEVQTQVKYLRNHAGYMITFQFIS